jgi:hypothetical protein
MRRLLGLMLLIVLEGCASSPLAQQVQARDWAGVERAVRDAQARGDWTAQDTQDLAQQVLEVEIKAAPSTAAKQWIPGLRGCAGAVLPALKARARSSDATAAAITRILIELDAVSLDELVDDHGASSDPQWRAVAMRAAVASDHGTLRLQGLRDADSDVRRAALVAVREAATRGKSPVPVEELLQIARHDPAAINRSLAARAATLQGNERAILYLRDYWREVPLDERVTYVEAWAQSGALAAGGERELEWVMGTDASMPGVVAALALQHRSPGARAVLVRTLHSGAPREQSLAARMVALQFPELLAALKGLLQEPGLDTHLKVDILVRLASVPKQARDARGQLKKLASSLGDAAATARHALADLGDASVEAGLLGELAFGSANGRLEAAAALLALGRDAKVAPLLGDRQRDTRIRAACLVRAPRPQ